MSTETAAPRAQDLLKSQFAFVYRTIGANIEGMSQEDSLESAGGNCANWILGHLTNVHNAVMQLVGEAPVWDSEQLANAGFEPITDAETAIDWDTMRTRFLASQDRCLAGLERLSAEDLAQPLPHPFGGETTRGELLALLAFHQGYHAGQLGMARRTAGHAGAIKAPGQS